MYCDHTVGVVVPAYNEENLTGRVIETMPAAMGRRRQYAVTYLR